MFSRNVCHFFALTDSKLGETEVSVLHQSFRSLPYRLEQTNTVISVKVCSALSGTRYRDPTLGMQAAIFKTAVKMGRNGTRASKYIAKLSYCFQVTYFLTQYFLGYYELFTIFQISDKVSSDSFCLVFVSVEQQEFGAFYSAILLISLFPLPLLK